MFTRVSPPSTRVLQAHRSHFATSTAAYVIRISAPARRIASRLSSVSARSSIQPRAAAALIMVAVFLSFVSTPLVTIKQLAVGLAASVAIDATVIRLLLVPATMYLFGDKNWWLPGWLDRLLPHVGEERAMPDDARAAR